MTSTFLLRRAMPLVFAFAVIGVAPAAAASIATTGMDRSAARSTSVEAEHVALREAIWRLERLLRQRLTAASRSGSPRLPGQVKTGELGDLLDVLRSTASKRVATEGRDLARKAGALTPLLRDLENREGAADGTTLPTSLWEPGSATTVLDAGAGATCESALDVVDGSYQATIGRRTDGTSGELWLRYSAKVGGMAVVSTAGSDFDTVVDWFDACPTAGAVARDHGDDEIGLQSRAAAQIAAGETAWIRIRGWEGATGMAAIRLEGGSSGLSGIVTNESSGEPLAYRDILVWSANGSYAGSEYTAWDGSYLIAGLGPGTYYASTRYDYDPDGFLDELYNDSPCAGGAPSGCSPTTGTPIVVQNGVIHGGIDFALGHGAAVAGRVRQAATGAAIPYVDVYVYGSGGELAGWVETDQAGRYLVSGLASGVAFAVAGDSYGSEYRRELYQGFSCTPSCNVATGTPIPVTDGQTTAGVDFDLERLGVVSGSVLRTVDGLPVGFARVDILDAQGSTRSWGYADAAGDYVAGGLNAGTYIAKTQTYDEYLDELFDDVPCDSTCNLASGTPITVALDDITSDIDFKLQRMGSISGLLTDAQTGDPLPGYSYLNAYDASGNYAGYGYSYDGTYSITALPAGTYYVRASHFPYRDEVYDDIPCSPDCDPTTGTPVAVALDTATTGIDFALTPLGSIAGTIVDAATSAPVGGVQVEVWNSGGYVTYSYSNDAGTYHVLGLPPGNYFVVAENYYFVNELYDNVPCPGGAPAGCDPTSGTSVAVTLGATTSAIDFALVRKGGIAGTVRDAATSAPLPYPWVVVYDSGGTLVAAVSGANDGTYEVAGLGVGSYFVIADSTYPSYYYSTHDAELYDNLPCPHGNCNPPTGTAVPVTLGALTTGIDFSLSRSGVISGLVTDIGGAPLSYAYVSVYDSTGQYRGYAGTDAQGRYQLPTEPGTWYLVVYGGSQYISQLYSGIPCIGSCNVTSGTPVVVTTGNATPNIDFALSYARGIVGRVTDNGHPLAGVAIDLWNTAGEHVASTVTGPSGSYHLEPDPGTYFVSTDSGMGAVEELWNNVACPLGPAYQGLCNPTNGTPIPIASWDSLVTGIDFALDGVELFVNSFEPGNRGWTWSP
jgi:protocatechuate 3,4-dioxygenase beta subunit